MAILPVGLGPGAHMRETQFLQRPVNRGIRYRQTELSVQLLGQITSPPAHHVMNGLDRPLVDETSEKLLVRGVGLHGAPGDGLLLRPSGPSSLNRITQSLSV